MGDGHAPSGEVERLIAFLRQAEYHVGARGVIMNEDGSVTLRMMGGPPGLGSAVLASGFAQPFYILEGNGHDFICPFDCDDPQHRPPSRLFAPQRQMPGRLTQAQLRKDLDLVRDWTDEHPEAYAGLVIHADNEPDEDTEHPHGHIDLLVVGPRDTAEITEMRGRLRFPDRLVVRSAQRTYAELSQLQDRISDDFADGMWGQYDALMVGSGEAENKIDIWLHPLTDQLARRVIDHYEHVSLAHWRNGGRLPDEA